jgi:hypothetical protein
MTATIDTGFQVIHVEEDSVRNGCKPIKSERVMHSLFRRCLSKKVEYYCY